MQISSSFHSWGTKPASTVLPGTAHTKAATSNIPIFYAKRVFLSQTHYFQTSPLLPYFWFLSEQASTSPASLSFLLTVMWRCFTHVFFPILFPIYQPHPFHRSLIFPPSLQCVSIPCLQAKWAGPSSSLSPSSPSRSPGDWCCDAHHPAQFGWSAIDVCLWPEWSGETWLDIAAFLKPFSSIVCNYLLPHLSWVTCPNPQNTCSLKIQTSI